MEKVSVIIPAYKAEKTIRNTIDSVIQQTYDNIEMLIIENGPKESIEDIVKGYENSKLNIKYFYCEKANVSNARNIGIRNSTGKYIAFIDSDDLFEKDFLTEMVAGLEKNCAQLISCGYRTLDNKLKRVINKDDEIRCTEDLQKYLEILKSNLLFNEIWNKIYISEIIKNNSIKFNEDYELGEDYLFNLDYLKNIKQACYINKPLYIYTVSDSGLKLKYRKDKFDIEYKLTQILKEYYADNNYSNEFVNNQFARIYYNGIIDIFKKNNSANNKEKDVQLERFINRKEYKEDLNYLKDNVTNKKFEIAIKYFFLKGKKRIKLFVILNKLFHK